MVDHVSIEKRSDIMRSVHSKGSGPEKIVRSAAHRMGLRYRLHRRDLPGSPDLVFSRHKTVIFVNGCFWHRHSGCKLARIPKSRQEFWIPKLEGNRIRDIRNQEKLLELGWQFLYQSAKSPTR